MRGMVLSFDPLEVSQTGSGPPVVEKAMSTSFLPPAVGVSSWSFRAAVQDWR